MSNQKLKVFLFNYLITDCELSGAVKLHQTCGIARLGIASKKRLLTPFFD